MRDLAERDEGGERKKRSGRRRRHRRTTMATKYCVRAENTAHGTRVSGVRGIPYEQIGPADYTLIQRKFLPGDICIARIHQPGKVRGSRTDVAAVAASGAADAAAVLLPLLLLLLPAGCWALARSSGSLSQPSLISICGRDNYI